ncbi:liver-expressed antimicrobial peptide 2-like [Epinephelus fuscoguttatus]|uniref:liver-expressed antimicrobial peptide 2 n=1 Tax=Epinephelus lanceolatus TaxID=310571 RepID=UPI0014474249|nr:liver-expressed antimicrobial peptide 2 [Epinephelus lanceolatus]XP_049460276.1 liver-expressed antimicrobial peptide 2-like [Epinephelus fuscoguttatus]XP_049909296.1 liver-expressed antimicrobial peptide 2-like [Epinephelus moara]
MGTLQERIIVLSVLLCLICAVQVNSLPVPEDWNGLILRTKRSLLWRWNSMKPVGASCRDNLECGTQYCRKNICSFRNST